MWITQEPRNCISRVLQLAPDVQKVSLTSSVASTSTS